MTWCEAGTHEVARIELQCPAPSVAAECCRRCHKPGKGGYVAAVTQVVGRRGANVKRKLKFDDARDLLGISVGLLKLTPRALEGTWTWLEPRRASCPCGTLPQTPTPPATPFHGKHDALSIVAREDRPCRPASDITSEMAGEAPTSLVIVDRDAAPHKWSVVCLYYHDNIPTHVPPPRDRACRPRFVWPDGRNVGT